MPCVEEPAGVEPESDDEQAGDAECGEDEGSPERDDTSAGSRFSTGPAGTGLWTVGGSGEPFGGHGWVSCSEVFAEQREWNPGRWSG
jgi:hypothetical protein